MDRKRNGETGGLGNPTDSNACYCLVLRKETGIAALGEQTGGDADRQVTVDYGTWRSWRGCPFLRRTGSTPSVLWKRNPRELERRGECTRYQLRIASSIWPTRI